MDKLLHLWEATGFYQMQPGQGIMILIGMLLLYLAIKKNFEPLLFIRLKGVNFMCPADVAGVCETCVTVHSVVSCGIFSGFSN